MAEVHGRIRVLTQEEMERLHAAALDILERAGLLLAHRRRWNTCARPVAAWISRPGASTTHAK